MLPIVILPELPLPNTCTHTHVHNLLLVKEKVPTFVRILGMDGASGVTRTVRGSGHHARMLAVGLLVSEWVDTFKLNAVSRRKI